MKTVMFANAVIMSTYAVCVTLAAIHFNNPTILWWYVMLCFIGFTCKSKEGKDNA